MSELKGYNVSLSGVLLHKAEASNVEEAFEVVGEEFDVTISTIALTPEIAIANSTADYLIESVETTGAFPLIRDVSVVEGMSSEEAMVEIARLGALLDD